MTNILFSVFLAALAHVESGNDARKIGKAGEVGIYQITPVCVRDVNRIYHTQFTVSDCKDPERAKAVCVLYLHHYADRYRKVHAKEPTVAVLARIWNGGPDGWKEPETITHAIAVQREYVRRLAREYAGDDLLQAAFAVKEDADDLKT